MDTADASGSEWHLILLVQAFHEPKQNYASSQSSLVFQKGNSIQPIVMVWQVPITKGSNFRNIDLLNQDLLSKSDLTTY